MNPDEAIRMVERENSYPPAELLHFMRGLPPGGTVLAPVRRNQVVAAFTALVNYLYPEPDTGP